MSADLNGYEALRTDAAWFDVSDRGKIRVSGEDRIRLLHAMTTNHIQNLAENHGLYTFFLNAQGRILADAFLFNLGDSLMLDTEPELRQKLSEHLDKYIIADDVTLEDETGLWASIAIEGPKTYEYLKQLDIPVCPEPLGVSSWNSGLVFRIGFLGGEGVEFLVPHHQRGELVSKLKAAGIPEASREDCEAVRLENGRPRYGQDITDRFLVQETGVISAVHFSKGCYLGQEIVERVRSRAQVHRHLRQVRVEGSTPLAPGLKLTRDGQPAAEITSSAFSPAWNAVAALAYVRTDAETKGTKLTVPETEPSLTAEVL